MTESTTSYFSSIPVTSITILVRATRQQRWKGRCALMRVGSFFGTHRSEYCVTWCLAFAQPLAFISESPVVALRMARQLLITVLPLPVSRDLSMSNISSGNLQHVHPHVTARIASSHERIKSRRIQAVRICSYRIWYLSSRPSAGPVLPVAARRQAYGISVPSFM